MKHIDDTGRRLDRELKKGSTELLILSLLETSAAARLRHQPVDRDAVGRRPALSTSPPSTPCSTVSSSGGLIEGRWVEKAGQRRRRYYRLTPAGRRMLRARRSAWEAFVRAMNRITQAEHA
jgi:hypothetical protein